MSAVVEELHDINAIKSGQVAVELPRRKLTIRKPSEILAMEIDPRARLLGDWLWAVGQFLTILGAGGTGKSRLLLQLAICMITGREFLGFEVRGRGLRWLILQTENSNMRLKQDLAALKAWVGPKEWALIDECLYIHTLETDEDGLVSLGGFENQQAIEDIIAEISPDLIAIDPLGDFAIGDPNKDSDMRDTCRAITQLCRKGNHKRAVVILHHALTGKAGAARATGYDRASFGRNSKVLQGWTRGQINVAAGSADDNATLVVSCGKCSNGKEFPAFAAKLDPETMIYEIDPDFDLEAWQAEVSGKKAGCRIDLTADELGELCGSAGKTKGEIAHEIIEDTGCSKSKAYLLVTKAIKTKAIIRLSNSKKYVKR